MCEFLATVNSFYLIYIQNVHVIALNKIWKCANKSPHNLKTIHICIKFLLCESY